MAGENLQAQSGEVQSGENQVHEKTFTQAEVNELMGKVRRETRDKYSDYDELKQKAAELDAAKEASKSELEKALERTAKAENELQKLRDENAHIQLVNKVAKTTGVPFELLHGSTEEELTSSAQALLAWQGNSKTVYPSDKGGGVNKTLTPEDIRSIKDTRTRVRTIAKNLDLFQ